MLKCSNYFDEDPRKLLSDQYLAKFLDTLAKLFFSCYSFILTNLLDNIISIHFFIKNVGFLHSIRFVRRTI